jgi:sulfatase maturation enzyme AslB (radical SAM superfamily)
MNDYYCVLPFYSVETDFTNPDQNIYCCRLAPGTKIEQVRADITNKTRSANCKTCWNLEDRGMTSERQVHNNTLDFLLDLNLDNIEKQSLQTGFDPRVIKLATSNLCNGQCVTCNSTWSSSWAALENKSTKYRGIRQGQVDFDIQWDKIVSLSFVGGEPLLEKQNFKILQTLLDLGNTNCFISIVTNGSIELSDSQVDVLKQFKNVNICISIDGVGHVFEYLRFPLKWDKLISNLNLFRSITNNISVSCMISNLSIYYYTEIMAFFQQHQLSYVCKQITHPAIFAPNNLPNTVKEIISDRNNKYADEVNAFLQLGNHNDLLYQKFLAELDRQHGLKQIELRDYAPELAYLL